MRTDEAGSACDKNFFCLQSYQPQEGIGKNQDYGETKGVSPEWRCIKRVFGSVNDVGFLEICGEA